MVSQTPHARAWTRSPDELVQIQLLDHIAGRTHDGSIPPLSSYIDAWEDPWQVDREPRISLDQLEVALKTLEHQQLVTVSLTLSGYQDAGAHLTPRGKITVRERAGDRLDPQLRSNACREAVLDWLRAEALRGNRSSFIEAFTVDPRARFWADPFTPEEIGAATRWLDEYELISGIKGGWGHGLVRADITPKGEDVIDTYGGSLPAWRAAQSRGGTSYTTHFNAEVFGQVGIGDHVTQHQHGLDLDTLGRLLSDVREAVQGLPETEQAYAGTYLDAVQAEVVQESPDRGLVKGVTERLKQIADKTGDATFRASVAALVGYVAQALLS